MVKVEFFTVGRTSPITKKFHNTSWILTGPKRKKADLCKKWAELHPSPIGRDSPKSHKDSNESHATHSSHLGTQASPLNRFRMGPSPARPPSLPHCALYPRASMVDCKETLVVKWCGVNVLK